MKQSPKQPAGVRQAQLIKAAKKVFMKKGYTGATTAEIAKTARLTKGALYFHFKNKEEVFFAVVKTLMDEATQPFFDLTQTEDDAQKFIEKVIDAGFDMMEEEKYLSLHLWQAAHKIKRIKEYITERHTETEEVIADHLCKLTKLKMDKSSLFVRLLHSFLDGAMIRRSLCINCDEDNLPLVKTLKEVSGLYINKNN